MIKLNGIFYALALLPCTAFATVGGPQTVEFLGYEAKAQKVYLLKHYQDGRGRLPQLYYYQFKNTPQPEKLIQVNSLYINPKTQKIDYDQDSRKFDQEILKIKKRLQPLQPIHQENIKIQIVYKTTSKEKSYFDPSTYIPRYTYRYQLKMNHHQSQMQQAVDYGQGLSISQAYKIPQQQKIVVAVKYLGIPFESGYSIEDAVLLSAKK